MGTGLVNVTKELHKHSLKFGFNYDVNLMNNRSDSPGNFNFGVAMTSCDPHVIDPDSGATGGPCGAENPSGNTGNAIASMLLGTGNGSANTSMDPAMSLHTFGGYFQDQWRLNQRLTVSAGLRYENQRPATERYNRVAYFDPKMVNPISTAFGSNVYGGFEFAGVDGRSRSAWEPDNKDFAPRVGVAYKISDKLVGRIGSGIFYGPSSAMVSFDGAGQSPGYTAPTSWIGTDGSGYIPTNLVDNPFPNGLSKPTGNALGAATYLGSGTGQLWPKGLILWVSCINGARIFNIRSARIRWPKLDTPVSAAASCFLEILISTSISFPPKISPWVQSWTKLLQIPFTGLSQTPTLTSANPPSLTMRSYGHFPNLAGCSKPGLCREHARSLTRCTRSITTPSTMV
jgi:hypothetical protein